MGEYLHPKRSRDAYSQSEIVHRPNACLRFEVAEALEGESFIDSCVRSSPCIRSYETILCAVPPSIRQYSENEQWRDQHGDLLHCPKRH